MEVAAEEWTQTVREDEVGVVAKGDRNARSSLCQLDAWDTLEDYIRSPLSNRSYKSSC